MNLYLLSPELSLVGFAVLVVILDLFIQNKRWLALISVVGLVVACIFSVTLWDRGPVSVFNAMLSVDNFGVFFKILFAGVSALVILASIDYVSRFRRFQGEFYALILFAAAGMMLMASVTELISLFVSLELVNLSLYALVSFLKDTRSTEASLKYLLLSAFSSAVILFGMALVFGFTGQTRLNEIARVIQEMPMSDLLGNSALLLGVIAMIAGLSFKIAAVPFHMWVPDVYEGAPTPITAYLSVGGKAAGFAIILRIFYTAFMVPDSLSLDWGMVFAVFAAISMTFGNIIAIQQTNIKRMMGYSSIAQVGYILIGLAATGISSISSGEGQNGIMFFLVSYALTNLVAFIAIIAVANRTPGDTINDFAGLGKRSPWLAVALSIGLISLVGIPPASGFMAKFLIFSSAVQHNLLWLVIIAVINTVISAYYYLRIVKVMWTGTPPNDDSIVVSGVLRTTLSLTSLGVLFLGIVPGLVIDLAGLSRLFGS